METKSWRKRLDARLAGEEEKAPLQPAKQNITLNDNYAENKGNIHSLKTNKTYNNFQDNTVKRSAVIEDLQKKISESRNMNNSSLIPPSIDPPKIPKSRAAELNKHNVRVYIIGFCFLWGTLLGFLYHISRDEPVRKEETSSVAKPTNNQTDLKRIITQKPDPIRNHDKEKILTKGDIPINIEKPSHTISNAKKELGKIDMTKNIDRNTTVIPSLPKFRYGGVSGRNAPLMKFSRSRQSATSPLSLPKPPVDSASFSGPELD
ncbi:MAG: hypothetical protein ACYTFY_01620 [Planctomycetota bacterium]